MKSPGLPHQVRHKPYRQDLGRCVFQRSGQLPGLKMTNVSYAIVEDYFHDMLTICVGLGQPGIDLLNGCEVAILVEVFRPSVPEWFCLVCRQFCDRSLEDGSSI